MLFAPAIQKDAINARTHDNENDDFREVGMCRLFAPLSATGLPPATHFWASGVIADEDVSQMKILITMFPLSTVTDWDDNKNPDGQEKFLAEKGLKRVYTPRV
jgi:hypothetical protein